LNGSARSKFFERGLSEGERAERVIRFADRFSDWMKLGVFQLQIAEFKIAEFQICFCDDQLQATARPFWLSDFTSLGRTRVE
jgi:hypothetical protein